MEELTWERINELGKIAYESKLFKNLDNEAQAVIKILKGMELGLPPIASLESINIIDGKVALSANLIASRIKQSSKYNFKTIKKTKDGAVIEFYENGQKTGESSFGIEEAKRAGIMDSWWVQKYPEDTFWARALTRGARTYCPDVFQGGSIYVAEELIREKTVEKPEKKPVEKPQSNERMVTNKQVNYLWVKAKEKALDSNSLVKLVKEQTGKNELKDMTYSDFNKVLGLIEAM